MPVPARSACAPPANFKGDVIALNAELMGGLIAQPDGDMFLALRNMRDDAAFVMGFDAATGMVTRRHVLTGPGSFFSETTAATDLDALPGGRGYVVRVQAPPEPMPDAATEPDPERLATRCAGVVNRAMETLIRQNPGQYLWGYHRYKAPRPTDSPAPTPTDPA